MNARLNAVAVTAALLLTGCGGPDYDPVQADEDCASFYATVIDQEITAANIEDVTEKLQELSETAVAPVAQASRAMLEPDWSSEDDERAIFDEYNKLCDEDVVF